MALYRLRLRTISRGKGELSVALAAYNAGERLYLEREDWTYDFSWRRDVLHTELVGACGWSREELWNEAEWERRRWDGVTAREVLVALPHELALDAQIELVRELAWYLHSTYGVAVDIAIHVPTSHAGRDERNVHAHLLMTAAVMTPQGLGERTRVWDDPFHEGRGALVTLRAEWGKLQNRALGRAGLDVRVDERSYADQGLDRIPGVHLGPVLTRLERGGTTTLLGDYNRAVAWSNRVRSLLGSEPDWEWAKVPLEVTDDQVLQAYRACAGRILQLQQITRTRRDRDPALTPARRREIEGTLRDLRSLYAALAPAVNAVIKEQVRRAREARAKKKVKEKEWSR